MEEQTQYTGMQSLNKTLAQTFLWMFLGVLATAIIAAITYYSGVVAEVAGAWVMIGIVQIVIALVMGLLRRE